MVSAGFQIIIVDVLVFGEWLDLNGEILLYVYVVSILVRILYSRSLGLKTVTYIIRGESLS